MKALETRGYKRDDLTSVLNYLLRNSLVECCDYRGANIEDDNVELIKVTRKGWYYLEGLIPEIRYWDEMKWATAMDAKYLDQMASYGKGETRSRIQAIRVFLEYMNEVERRERESAPDDRWAAAISEIMIKKFNEFCTKNPQVGDLRIDRTGIV